MNSVFYFFGTYVPYLLSGWPVQFRVRKAGYGWKVESRGGKFGPFWGFTSVSDFEHFTEAKKFALKWAEEAGGVFIDDKANSTSEKKPYHTHRTEEGLLVRCYHNSKNTLLSFNFWLGVTLSFPLEHFIWTKVWPFAWITEYFHLLHD